MPQYNSKHICCNSWFLFIGELFEGVDWTMQLQPAASRRAQRRARNHDSSMIGQVDRGNVMLCTYLDYDIGIMIDWNFGFGRQRPFSSSFHVHHAIQGHR